MLACEAAGTPVQAVGRRIGFSGVQINNLDRRGRVWLRWAAQRVPPKRQWDVTLFRQRFEEACQRLGVDVERIAAEK